MNEYDIYKDNLNTNELFRIELSKNNTEPVQIVVRYVNNINEAINKNIIFNNKEPNICYIIIDYKDYKKTKEIIAKAWNDLNRIPVKENIKVVYTNETEKQIAYFIDKSMNNVIIEEQKDNKKENEVKEEFNKFLSARTITKEDNGIIRKYVERTSDNFNTGYMLEGITTEEMYNKYNELLNDNNNKERFSTMNEQEIANFVLDYIASSNNHKKYYLESAEKQTSTNKVGAIASNVAKDNDGVVNKEIGVVINSPTHNTKVNTVEENNNKVNVVEPKTIEENISQNNYGFNHSSTNDYYRTTNSQDNNYYNSNNEAYNKDNIYVKKKVLSKPYTGIEQPRGIITVPAIIFILSGLLLVSSLILFIASK